MKAAKYTKFEVRDADFLDGLVLALATKKGHYVFSDGYLHHFAYESEPLNGEYKNGKPTITFPQTTKDRKGRNLVQISFEGKNYDMTEIALRRQPDWLKMPILSFSSFLNGEIRNYQATVPRGGIALIDPNGVREIIKLAERAVCSNSTDNELIVGLYGGRIISYNPSNPRQIPKILGRVDEPRRIIFENGNMYVASNEGFYQYSDGKFKEKRDKGHRFPNCVGCVKNNDTLYIANGTAIVALSRQEMSIPLRMFELSGRTITYFGRLNEKEALVGTKNGNFYSIKFEKLKEEVIYHYHQNEGRARSLDDLDVFKPRLSISQFTTGINSTASELVYHTLILPRETEK